MLDGARREVLFDGCRVRYVRAGTPGATPLLLVHGGGAHKGWWTGVVPRLADRFDLLVPDLSGHGASEHRREYAPELWARELAAILDHAGVPAVRYVGHSMGGLIGIFMAGELPERVQSLVIVDSGLRRPDEATGSAPRGRERRPTPVYPTEEAALARFRLRPSGTSAPPELLRRVGRHGLRRVPTGWTWSFDPGASRRFTDNLLHAALPDVACPVGIVYGEHSEIAGPPTVSYVESRLGRHVPSIEVPNAHHHIPLDEPEACAAAITTMVDRLGAGTSDDVRETAVEVDRRAGQV